jgi:3-hydroxyacyl-CoA dehydrogenase/enoyl-CoA hydratase/carnithine racemase
MMSDKSIFQMEKKGNIGIVTFNVSGQPMNTWTEKAIQDFLALVDELEKASDLTGLIFISGKPGVFHAGANLNMLEKMTDRAETAKVLDVFHDEFKRLEALSFPTVAAIDGHCLGGGLEFALACKARIAKDSKFTNIGLPECSLGILPGGGGTQRLPRLIGLAAIEPILRGSVFSGKKAHEMGIVDRLVPADGDLLAEAVKFLEEIIADNEVLTRRDHDFSNIDQIADMARQGVLKVTRGREIPGPMLAVKSIQEGLKVSLAEGLDIEKNSFVDAVLSDQAKGGIHTFFLKTLSDKPKSMMTKGFRPKPIEKVGVLGFGTMGRGIVIDILRRTRIPVVVKDIPDAAEPGTAFVKKILTGMAEKKRLKEPVDDVMKRLTVVSEYGDHFKNADLVVEAVFEDLKVKEQVYGELCKVVRDDCVIASNTSSIPLDAMSQFVTKPERFGGLHFFSPVWLMQLVEVIKGKQTSQDTVDNLLGFVGAIRKRPIVCKDNPGFVVNAVLFPYFMRAMAFLEGGNSIEDIDAAFVKFGMPIGPIRLTDEVGIDVCYNVLKGRGQKQDTLRNVVEDGRLGLKKSGKGFFLKDGSVDPDVLPLIVLKDNKVLTAEEMQIMVLKDMIAVAKDLLDRGIVDDPRMVDIGMIWGTGFPPDKGGPLKWADLIGLSKQDFGTNFYEPPAA